jgi:hypothetical protein
VALLERFIHGLTATPEEIRNENLRQWASSIEGTTRIRDVSKRERCKVAGVIQTIRIDPRSGGSIEATISDGTGSLIAKWLGRPTMSGIRLGEGLALEGAVGTGADDLPMILNPEYRLVSGPEHG